MLGSTPETTKQQTKLPAQQAEAEGLITDRSSTNLELQLVIGRQSAIPSAWAVSAEVPS